ncbi:MAG: hypothetical protein HGA31_03620 [Candidatus Moranbacteria bacterium]|nr:hypothetical protein [Candidatus Moranbacteria bacterium]
MPQIFYIAQDEEILSIIGRLRMSSMLEVIFVLPKRALVLGSVVNLRLLAREAEKAGKHILIVTQDDSGRVLAEKAGIQTRPYSDELLRDDRVQREQPVLIDVQKGEEQPRQEVSYGIPVDTIGSQDFYSAQGDATETVSKEPEKEVEKIRIRPGLPRREFEPPIAKQSAPESRSRISPSPVSGPGKLTEMFRQTKPATSRKPDSVPEQYRRPTESSPKTSSSTVSRNTGKGHPWFYFFASISILFLVGTAAILFLPKAEVDVTPKSASKSMELDFQGKTGAGAASSDREIPIRIVSFDEEETVTMKASGASSTAGQKSTGTVVIYNEYGTDPQQLVATTRLESSDGKIFRIAKGVTVPGMTTTNGKTVPGAVEATIVADGVGSSYDIGPSSFSIPGFKGTPKFDAFSAKSTQSFRGGSTGGGGGVSTVTDADLTQAKKDAENKFRTAFQDSLSSDSSADERFVPDSIGVSVIGTPVHPEAGFATESFEYKIKYSGKAFLFSESKLKQAAGDLMVKNSALGEEYTVQDITVEYLARQADYVAGNYPIGIRATALFVASVDINSLRNDLLGKNLKDVQTVLDRHPEVGKVEISWPLPTPLPGKTSQIKIVMKSN